MKSEVTTKRRSPSKRKYGGLTAVDAVGYLDAIEKVHADTIVVVLIYDDQVGTPCPFTFYPISSLPFPFPPISVPETRWI